MTVVSPSSADEASALLHSTFRTHCIKCHGKGDKVEGEVNLLALQSNDNLQARPELLETLITVLQDRQMPPEDEPALPKVKREQMVTALQTMLQQTLKTQAFGGHTNPADESVSVQQCRRRSAGTGS